MSGGREQSYLKFNYALRPSKQVERKLIIKILNTMRETGYKISQYTYVGFGSVYYADFIVFHKYLYIDKMICVEASNIDSRMEFNKPFGFIDLRMALLSEVIPTLDERQQHFVWADYDSHLDREMLDDLDSLCSSLRPGSFIAVTVDAENRVPIDSKYDNFTEDEKIDAVVRTLDADLSSWYGGPITKNLYTRADLPGVFATTLINRIRDSLVYREGVEFLPLFCFKYADGAQMLSLGGILDSAGNLASLRETLAEGLASEADWPVAISMPVLTLKEKQWLDQHMEEVDDVATQVAFEIEPAMFDNYRRYYREYPIYVESLF